MKNTFEKMIDDCFKIKDFIEYFQDQTGKNIVCISYSIDTGENWTQYGIDTGVNFYITCKAEDFTPKKGVKITFRGKQYKIQSFETDAFNLSHKIYLKSLTSK